MIVQWPGQVPSNSINQNYLIIEDFYPTILEMAGITDYHTIQQIDGKSFFYILKNNPVLQQDRPLYWHYPNEWGPSGPGIGAFSAIRQGDWKLIYYHKHQNFELFNIKEDIGETINLAETKPEKVKFLAEQLTRHLKKVDAQMTSSKKTGYQTPYPDEVILK
jgi:arylsulfatase A-like enzyme